MAFHTENHIFRRIHCDHHRNDTFYLQFSTLEEKTQRMETASAKRYRNRLYRRLKYCLQSNWKRSKKICLGRRSGGIPSDFPETKNRSTMTTIEQTFREIVFLFFFSSCSPSYRNVCTQSNLGHSRLSWKSIATSI